MDSLSLPSQRDPKVLLGRWLRDTSATNHHPNIISKRSTLGCLCVNLALTSCLKCIGIVAEPFQTNAAAFCH